MTGRDEANGSRIQKARSAGKKPAAVQKPGPGKKPAPPAGADTVFGTTRVWPVHLTVTQKNYAAMQPALPMRLPGAPDPPVSGEKPTDTHKGSGMGIEFPWVHADLTVDGKTFRGIGLRYKGNASYGMLSRGLRRNFRVDLDHYGGEARFRGLKAILLHAGGLDPSRSRETLSYAVFRAAGVPAPRTAYAELTLTLPGRYDREYVGLYTLIEPVDKGFLRSRFQNDRGMLLKPDGVREILYLGDDWERYAPRYLPKGKPTEAQKQRLIAFARLVDRGTDDAFRTQIGSFLDTDAFLRFVAVNALLVTIDNFFTSGHNFYLYLDPRTDRFVFVPWDMDVSWAGVPFVGTAEQRMDLSLTHPHPGRHNLIDRLLAIPDVRDRYRKLLEELAGTVFSPARLTAQIAAVEKVVAPRLARERRATQARGEAAGGPGFGFAAGQGMFGQGPELRTFVAKRTASIVAQLSGARTGWVPDGAFGPPQQNPVADLGPRFVVFREPVQAELGLDDAQKRRLKAWADGWGARIRALSDEMPKLPPEARGARMQATRQEAERQLEGFLPGVLSGGQLRRLRELVLQQEGPFVFLQPDIAEELGLSENQRRDAMRIVQELQRKAEPLMRRMQSGGDPSEIGPKMQALRQEHAERLAALLDPTQKVRWRRMLGKPSPP